MLNNAPLGKILLVDDDSNIVDLLMNNLEAEGFQISNIPNSLDVNLDEICDVRMVIVDAMSQQYTGVQLTADMKAYGPTEDIPVILCTNQEGEDVVVTAFDAGVDDYVIKPFSLRELMARIKAVLRRHPRKAASRPNAAPRQKGISVPSLNLFIDTQAQKLEINNEIIPLTKTEYLILIFLIKNQNEFFSRNDICDEVWKEEAGTNARIVDTNISRLRKKLGEQGKHIINRYGLGYAFVEKPS